MTRRIVVLLLVAIPLQGMFYRATSRTARKKPVRSTASVKYQKAAAAQKFLQRAQIHQQGEPIKTQSAQKIEPVRQKIEPPKQGLVLHQKITDDKRQRFTFERPTASTKGTWGALLAALGLGWLWYSSEDEEADAVFKRCEESNPENRGQPFSEFAKFVEKYGDDRRSERLFERMIGNSKVLFNMWLEVTELKNIPSSVIPFIKRHYYTLACSKYSDASYVLDRLIKIDSELKKDLTVLAIRDMEKLCRDAQSDDIFSSLMVDNPEAVNGFLKKATGHVEELVATKVGKQLIDNNLVRHSCSQA